MRILVISNLYPPYYVGGYEIGCRDVVEALKTRGHEVKVLTSTYGVKGPQSDGEVYRWMEAHLGHAPKWKVVLKELVNQTAFTRLCDSFQPDVAFLWNLTHVSISCAFLAQQRGLATCYYVFDNWLANWEVDYWYRIWRKILAKSDIIFKLLGCFMHLFGLTVAQASLNLKYAMFASKYLKDFAVKAGKPVNEAPVIPWGIEINRFPYRERPNSNTKRLLYVGQILPHKGVHTVIEAFSLLVREYDYDSISFTIVGNYNYSQSYTSYLKDLANTGAIEGKLNFVNIIPREKLLRFYHDHDILVFPSVWDEPFGIVLLEAMSCGLAVVGTGTGGSSEILEGEVNAMVFPKEDAEACAKQIKRLLDNPNIFEQIRQNGRRTVEEKYQIEPMIDLIEEVLLNSIEQEQPDGQYYLKLKLLGIFGKVMMRCYF
jgi:glycogen(starch) synthase